MNLSDISEDKLQGEGASISWILKNNKQWSTKWKLLEVCSGGERPCLKGAQAVKWGRILGGTAWSQDPRGHKQTGHT